MTRHFVKCLLHIRRTTRPVCNGFRSYRRYSDYCTVCHHLFVCHLMKGMTEYEKRIASERRGA